MPEKNDKRQKKKGVIHEGTLRTTKATKGLSNRDLRRPSSQFVCADSPFKGNRDESGPPGNAGVPPASSPFACRSVSLRCRSRPPCRREPHGPGRSRALAPLPVDRGGGDGRGYGKNCAGGTPALPGGLYSMTSSNPRRSIRLRVYSCSFVVRLHLTILPILCIHVQ